MFALYFSQDDQHWRATSQDEVLMLTVAFTLLTLGYVLVAVGYSIHLVHVLTH